MKKDRIFNIAFIIFLIFLIFLAFYILTPFITPLIWSIIAVIIFYPIHIKLVNIIKSENLSSFIITMFILVLIILPVSIFGVLLVEQGMILIQNVSAFLMNLNQDKIYIISKHIPIVGKHITYYKFLRFLHLNAYMTNQSINSMLSSVASFLGNQFKNMVFFVGFFMLKILIFLMSTFFLLRDWDKLINFIRDIMPISTKDFDAILTTVYSTVIAVVYGFVGTALIQAILGFFMYYYIVPTYALVLAFMTFIASFIPPLGTAIIWIPYSMYVWYYNGFIYFVGSFTYSVVFIIGADNFIRPLLMKKGAHIPYILLSLSVLGGLFSLGFLGMFLGPIVFTTLITSFSIYKEKFS